ncbi:hypothetical protein Tco_1256893 [Tanacetum coccineum]
MEKTRSKREELLPYGMLLTRLFKHIVSISPELAFDHYLAHDRAIHPLAPRVLIMSSKNASGIVQEKDLVSKFYSSSPSPFHPSSYSFYWDIS